MTKRLTRFWYKIKTHANIGVDYLVFAESEKQACELLGVLEGESEIDLLTWRDMTEITGCVKPAGLCQSDFVTFFPVFQHGEYSYSLMA